MHRLLVPISLAMLLCTSALAADRYLDAGAPAASREWRAADYQTVVELLSEKKVPLPTLADEDGKKVLERICDTRNLKFGRNPKVPFPERFKDYAGLLNSAGQITQLYATEASASGKKVAAETTLVLSFMLHLSALGTDLLAEFEPNIPKDANYGKVMGGVKQMKDGFTIILDGAYTSIATDTIYDDAQRSTMLAAVAETAPQFSSILQDDTRKEMTGKFAALKDRFKSEQDQKSLETITKVLAEKPATGE